MARQTHQEMQAASKANAEAIGKALGGVLFEASCLGSCSRC